MDHRFNPNMDRSFNGDQRFNPNMDRSFNGDHRFVDRSFHDRSFADRSFVDRSFVDRSFADRSYMDQSFSGSSPASLSSSFGPPLDFSFRNLSTLNKLEKTRPRQSLRKSRRSPSGRLVNFSFVVSCARHFTKNNST